MDISDAIELVLVDFDDTLVDTAPRFERARRELYDLLARAGFDAERIEWVHHHEVDPGMRERHGLGPSRMPEAFAETYRALCRHARRDPEPATLAACRRIGAGVAGTPPGIDGALAALERLAGALPTAVYTQAGDRAYQLGCLREAGALDVVGEDRVHVVPVKTATALQETLKRFGVAEPRRAWMVGNSLRSDINPALEVGVRAIHVHVEEPWQHDVVDPLHDDFLRAASFADAVDLLLDDRTASP